MPYRGLEVVCDEKGKWWVVNGDEDVSGPFATEKEAWEEYDKISNQ